ncbi:Hypothetical_protein [Hexamita inflata]|uniref:Hypothetical_protein n=1 Tax=Hexamita inflata TaxID=28002 RepID=A0AA86UY09_9EUKA|nr:Hypothetical protein HINF_LOCUS60164 [Hexamita inflata]
MGCGISEPDESQTTVEQAPQETPIIQQKKLQEPKQVTQPKIPVKITEKQPPSRIQPLQTVEKPSFPSSTIIQKPKFDTYDDDIAVAVLRASEISRLNQSTKYSNPHLLEEERASQNQLSSSISQQSIIHNHQSAIFNKRQSGQSMDNAMVLEQMRELSVEHVESQHGSVRNSSIATKGPFDRE